MSQQGLEASIAKMRRDGVADAALRLLAALPEPGRAGWGQRPGGPKVSR